MKTEDEDQPILSLEAVLADEKLTRLRRAYHELEAYQLSPEHDSAKKRLRESLSQPDSNCV
jgi:hypothetical protein